MVTVSENLKIFENYTVTDEPLSIEDIKILYGANFFSGGPVVRFRLNLGSYDEVFSDSIEGFYERLLQYMPSLVEHYCSVGKRGGFLLRVQEGTLLGHIMEHIAIEFQNLAGIEAGFGKTRMTKTQGVYNVIFRYIDELAGIYAGKAACNFLNALLTGQSFDVKEIVRNLIIIREKRLLGPSTQAIVDEAERRNIPFIRMDKYNRVQVGTGKFRKIIRATITDSTSLIGVETTDDKFSTSEILAEAGIPIPRQIITEELADALTFHQKIKQPLVVKPAVGYQGKHISIELNTKEQIEKAFGWAKAYEDEVIVQEFVPGNTYRLLTVDYRFVAAVLLRAPFIVGDGQSTVQQLVDKLNEQPERQLGDKGKLTKVEIDEDSLHIFEIEGYTLDSVLEKNKQLWLKNSGNMRLGGASTDVTAEVNPFNRFIAERISRLVDLNVAGIDIIAPDISQPLSKNAGKLIEVNAAPDFRMHLNPTLGKPQHVEKQFIDMLFPGNTPQHIPLISITGSQGKQLAAAILNYCLSTLQINTAWISRTGMFIGNNQIMEGDATDSPNVQIALKDPTIECAVVETPVESILKSGLGYQFADFGVVLNLAENPTYYTYDHIRDADDIAYTKSVVAEQVYDEGYTILNADEQLIYEMEERLYSNLALFSKNSSSERVKKLLKTPENAAVVLHENSVIRLMKSHSYVNLLNIAEIPVLQNNKEAHSLDSVLAATLVMHLFGVENEKIIHILKTFGAK